jgi:chorismate--pyruvate lyase
MPSSSSLCPWLPRLPRRNAAYHAWLTERGSLTRRIVSRCRDGFRVRVLRFELGKPCQGEARLLGLAPCQLAWIREVLLYCGDQPVVFAHSVLPTDGINGPWRSLTGLGNRPLGEALFSDPRIERGRLNLLIVNPRHPLHRRVEKALAVPNGLPARRSLFSLSGHPILVTEVFLPAILGLS